MGALLFLPWLVLVYFAWLILKHQRSKNLLAVAGVSTALFGLLVLARQAFFLFYLAPLILGAVVGLLLERKQEIGAPIIGADPWVRRLARLSLSLLLVAFVYEVLATKTYHFKRQGESLRESTVLTVRRAWKWPQLFVIFGTPDRSWWGGFDGPFVLETSEGNVIRKGAIDGWRAYGVWEWFYVNGALRERARFERVFLDGGKDRYRGGRNTVMRVPDDLLPKDWNKTYWTDHIGPIQATNERNHPLKAWMSDGERSFFYEDGKRAANLVYLDGELNGRCQVWANDGTLVQDREYLRENLLR